MQYAGQAPPDEVTWVAQVACNLCGEAARGNRRQPAVALVAARHGLQATRASVTVSVFGQRGASPFQACVLRPVSEGNCVVARRGGKQPEENDQSVTLCELDSACLSGEPPG